MTIRKLGSLCVAASMLFSSLVYVSAESKMSVIQLDIDTTVAKAQESSMVLRQLKNAKDSAMRGYSASENGGSMAQNVLEEYYSYSKLYGDGAKDDLDRAALAKYQAMFGNQPSLNNEQLYDRYVVPSQVAPYNVYVQFQSIKLDEASAISNIKYQSRQLYYGVLSYEKSIKLLEESLALSEKKFTEIKNKYKLGQASKYEVDTQTINVYKAKVELSKNKKELDSLKTQLKLLIGQDSQVDLQLKDVGIIKAEKNYTYENLVNEALINRVELKKQKLQIDSLENEVKLMSRYIRDALLDRRVDADQRLLSAKLDYADTEKNIRIDVLSVYNDYKFAENGLALYKEKVEVSQKQLNQVKQLFLLGKVKELDVIGAEIQLKSNQLSYENAVYEYNKKLDAVKSVTLHSVN